jgi:hypothetical protein
MAMMSLRRRDYDPNGFIDWARGAMNAKSDAELARMLGTTSFVISKIRHRKLHVTLSMVIALHEETGMRTLDIKAKMFRPVHHDDHAQRLPEAA